MKTEMKDFEKFAKEGYSVVPICKEFYADDVTPITLLRRCREASRRFFLLESIEGGEKWGRYSFLSYDPVMRVYATKNQVFVEKQGKHETPEPPETLKVINTTKPLDVLREIMKDYQSPTMEGLPPFAGGFVGYFGYAMMEHAEPTLDLKRGDFHDMDVMLFDKVIAYDHLKQKIQLIVNAKTSDGEAGYEVAIQEIEKMVHLLREDRKLSEEVITSKAHFTCDVSENDYAKMVNRAKEYIREGDIFQAVLSRRFESPWHNSLFQPYRVLRTTNPSPYMVYMSIDGDEIMSTSPETLVRVQDGRIVTFPVAGSRPRGKDVSEDEALVEELLKDEKELAEHNMLVDLGRNDLGRVSRLGSVEVTKYKMVHKYSKIMHICSQVEGDIADGKDAFDAIASVLPAGTLSGAPKIRACEIIDELEKHPRNIYGGALGYFDFRGNMDTCIAIRMAVKKGEKVYVQAGGGIVADSVPKTEFEESANKAKAVIQAIENVLEVDA